MRVRIALAVLALAATGAIAQTFPSKPVTIVVPFSAGGPTDTVARSLGQAMTKHLGQTVIVENVGGAGGTVGAARVKNANPDGYTILLHHIGMSTAPALYRKLQYNPVTDFEMVGLVVDVPMTLVARSDFPAKDFKELVAYLKQNASKINLANAGLGSASHLCGLMFMSAIEADLTTVPFKGTADSMNALLGKQVDVMCDQTTNTTGQIKAGTIKAYAVTSAKRVSTLPDLPTMQETGLKGFEVGIWHGLYAPKGTPKAAIDKLNAALVAAAKEPDFVKRMTELGATVYSADKMTPAAHLAHLKAEIDKWGPVIRKAGQYAD
ncbi:MAG TPA: tripartite tricarboxylate transporter substrate binding protein BugD [Burkholderiaceae bacterium]|jgi:tripartite-type tricarboxylate transporter receptor subunit TctC|nr:tripartite tricarboxylate transporter substrate binding protein BugD [Burkholderiaceae bacterium]